MGLTFYNQRRREEEARLAAEKKGVSPQPAAENPAVEEAPKTTAKKGKKPASEADA